MKFISFAPIEAIPSQVSIAKLLLCDRVIFADNLTYNKRHKYNAVQINDEDSFSFPIEKNPKYYRDAKFDITQKYQEKFIHIIKKQFDHQDYSIFLTDDILRIIDNETQLFGMHKAWMNLLDKHLNIAHKLAYASDFSQEFDIVEIASRDENSIVLLDPIYKDFADSKKIPYQLFNYDLIQADTYHRELKKSDSSLQLIYEFGPYLNRLFKIA